MCVIAEKQGLDILARIQRADIAAGAHAMRKAVEIREGGLKLLALNQAGAEAQLADVGGKMLQEAVDKFRPGEILTGGPLDTSEMDAPGFIARLLGIAQEPGRLGEGLFRGGQNTFPDILSGVGDQEILEVFGRSGHDRQRGRAAGLAHGAGKFGENRRPFSRIDFPAINTGSEFFNQRRRLFFWVFQSCRVKVKDDLELGMLRSTQALVNIGIQGVEADGVHADPFERRQPFWTEGRFTDGVKRQGNGGSGPIEAAEMGGVPGLLPIRHNLNMRGVIAAFRRQIMDCRPADPGRVQGNCAEIFFPGGVAVTRFEHQVRLNTHGFVRLKFNDQGVIDIDKRERLVRNEINLHRSCFCGKAAEEGRQQE